jgi:hypothetical protein
VTSDHYTFSWYRGDFGRNRSSPPPHQMQSAHASAPMRHTILCLMIAFLAAFLTPIICLLLLFILMPEIFKGDALVWMFLGPALFLPLLTITIAAGSIALFVAKAKLADRGWRSLQTFNILLAFTATVTAAGAVAWPYFETPPEIGHAGLGEKTRDSPANSNSGLFIDGQFRLCLRCRVASPISSHLIDGHSRLFVCTPTSHGQQRQTVPFLLRKRATGRIKLAHEITKRVGG